MKKGFKAVTAAALAISALTPVAAFAAENTVENGVYTTTNFYSLDAFKKLSGSAKAAALTSEGAVIVVAGKVYTGANVLKLNDTQLDASAVTVDAYNAANDNKLVSGKPIGEGTQAEDIKVESVKAINAQKIEVKFSKEVVGGSAAGQAENTAVYSIAGLAGGTTITPELQSDNKTVILTLSAPIVNDTTVVVTVDPVTSKADGTKSTDRFTTSFKFNDTVKPTYVGYDNKTPGTVTVKFSEELDPTEIVSANIVVTKADGTVVSTAGGAGNLTLTPKDNGFELSGLESNVEYKVAVKDFKDLAGNLTSPNVVSFTVKSSAVADTEAPKVTDIVSKGLDHVVIHVSEELENQAVAPAQAAYVTLAGVTPDATVAQVYDKTAGTVTVQLDGASLPSEGDVKTITVSAYKDLAGNTGANFVKSVGFSAISKVVKSEVVAKTTAGVSEDYIKVTFDKDIAFTTPGGAVSATLLTKDNVEKTVTIPAANFAKGTSADKELNVLYIKVEGLTGLEEGKLDIPVTQAVVTSLGADTKVTVDYKAISSDLTAPAIDTTVGTNGITVAGNVITVKYTQDMGQSALDVNNYTVDGVKVFESAIFKGDKKTVDLTLKPNALPLTANYDVKISKSVSNEKGVSLKADYVTTETITETVQPELKKAVVATDGSTVTLTFSEAVSVSADAFELFADGEKVPTTVTAIATNAEATTATISVTTPLTAAQIAKTLTVKLANDAVVKDVAGNTLKTFESLNVALGQ